MPLSSSLLIRTYDSSDRAAVIDLWRQCGLTRDWNDPELDILRKQAVGADLFLVGVVESTVVASVMGGYDGHRGWMYYLASSPSHQQSGFGRAMVSELERRLKSIGCAKINLQVREGNEAVLEFYSRLGYRRDAAISLGKRLIADRPEN